MRLYTRTMKANITLFTQTPIAWSMLSGTMIYKNGSDSIGSTSILATANELIYRTIPIRRYEEESRMILTA